MTKYYGAGTQIAWGNYGLSEELALDGVNSYGDLTNGVTALTIGDELEFKYRTLIVSGSFSYLTDSSGDDRGFALIGSDHVISVENNYDITIDGIEGDTLPDDSGSHTILLTAKQNVDISIIGKRESSSSGFLTIVFESIKLNGVGLDTTWVDRVKVGGESDNVSKFEGNHFLELSNATSALPATPTEDYEIQFISDTEEATPCTLPASFNNKTLTILGRGYTYNSIRSNTDITLPSGSVAYQLVFESIKFNDIFPKNGTNDANIFIGNNSVVISKIKNCEFRGNDNKGPSIYSYQSVSLEVTNCISTNKENGYYCGGNANTKLENCIAISCVTGIGRWGGAVIRNSYFEGSTLAIWAGLDDDGSNSSSDSSAFSADLRNISPTDAFADTASGDFTPNLIMREGVAPTIVGHTHYKNGVFMRSPYYIGALGVSSGINSSRKRKIRMIIMGY